MLAIKFWLSPKEASPVIGDPVDKIYRDIRLDQFPFEFVRIGKRIKISAKSLGLISPIVELQSEAEPQDETLAEAA